MIWSPYQEAIFATVELLDKSVIVEAVAGSGKTTTLVEIINRISPDRSACFVAFNKSIATALAGRVSNPHARCMTLHAVGWGAWRGGLGWDASLCRLDARKVYTILSEKASWQERSKYGAGTTKLVALAKGVGILPDTIDRSIYTGLVEDSEENWQGLMDLHNLDETNCSISLARRVLAESIYRSREVCDFDDQLYMPIVSGCAFEQYDVVLLDEAQDVNALQIEMVSRMVRPGGRLIAVGDRKQAIYGFRGAHHTSMDLIKERFAAIELPLSISYRCPRRVVEHARQWVPQIEHREGAEEGVLCFGREEGVESSEFGPSDVILCRLNRPLVSLAFRLIRKRVACRIAGREIGKGLVDLVKSLKCTTILDLDERLTEWRRVQIRRAKGDEGKVAGVNDRVDTLLVFMDQLRETDAVSKLISEIEGIFIDPAPGSEQTMLLLSTVHKAKGGQWPRVFILDADQFMPMPWAKAGWQMEQESHIKYVAATRAMRELHYITSEGIR